MNSKVNIRASVKKEIDRRGYGWIFPCCIEGNGYVQSLGGIKFEYTYIHLL